MSDYTYLSLGAGLQSSTIAEMVVEGELDKPDLVIFADTGDEPDFVYEQVEYLEGRLAGVGVELVTVSAGSLPDDLQSATKRFAAIPVFSQINGKRGRLKRQCTSDYKIEPITKELKRHLLARGLAKQDGRGVVVTCQVENWLGISLDEVQRMKPARESWLDHRWPLIDRRMTRNDCRQWLKRHDLRIPGKSSCRICPFHSDSYWRAMRDTSTRDWQFVTGFDTSLRENSSRFAATAKGELYLHRQCIPLAEVDLRTPEKLGQMRLLDDDTTVCDEGYCFV